MIGGLRVWRDQPGGRGAVESTIGHDGWTVETRRAPVGVVGFVFEGRPERVRRRVRRRPVGQHGRVPDRVRRPRHRTGDRRARARPGAGRRWSAGGHGAADRRAGPGGQVMRLFDDRRLALAVARGSGAAVAELGAVAAQAGTPVSLHGTGGAWMIVGEAAESRRRARRRRQFARPQGVQHAQRLRHPAVASRR